MPLAEKSRRNAPLLIILFMWGVYLGFPLQSLQGARCSLFGQTVPVYYFFAVLPVLVAAALALYRHRDWSHWQKLWWLLPLLCLPGMLFSEDLLWSVRQWFSLLARGILPGGVVFLIARRDDIQKPLIRWLMPIVIATSIFGLVEVYRGQNPLAKYMVPETSQPNNPLYRPNPYNSATMYQAPEGTQGNRIPYSATLVAFLPLSLWLLKYGRKSYWAPAVAILLSILILAQVRTAWLATLVTLVLMPALGLVSWKETGKIIGGLVLFLGLFLAIPRTHGMLWARFHSFHSTQLSIRQRLMILRTAAILKDRGLLGVGYGQFPTACRRLFPVSSVYWNDVPANYTPDNQYLRWAIENGVPSLALLLAFFAGLIRAGWSKLRSMPEQEAQFYKSLLIGWASLAATFLFFDGFYWGTCNMTFWLFLAMFSTALKSGDIPP